MTIDQTTLDQIEAHAPYVILIAAVVILAIILTVAAIADTVDRRRRKLQTLDQILAEDAAHSAGLQRGSDAGWHR